MNSSWSKFHRGIWPDVPHNQSQAFCKLIFRSLEWSRKTN